MAQERSQPPACDDGQSNRRKRPRWVRGLWLIPLLAAAAFMVWRSRQPARVEVVYPQQRMVVQMLTASGRVAGAREVELSVEQPGVLVEVAVKEGDLVAAGQVVARTSAEVESAELAHAQAAVATARAQVAEARAGARSLPASVEQAQAEVTGGIEQARERLAAAQARLAELHAGGRPEERREAEATVQQAQAQVEQAEKDVARARDLASADATARAALERAQAAAADAGARVQQAQTRLEQAERDLARSRRLYEQGVVAQAQYEAAQTAERTARETLAQARAQLRQAEVEVDNQRTLLQVTREAELDRAQTALRAAREQLEAARARLELVSGPARREQIEQAQAEVRSARAALEAAERAGPARVQSVRLTPAQERVTVAQRRLDEALRARDAVFRRLQATEVVARFDGIVTRVSAQAGDVVNPGQPVIAMSEMQWPEVHVEIDERDIALVAVGQRAYITADAHPERRLEGEVARIGAEAVTERGIMDVVLRPDERPPWLRSGMTVDAGIVVAGQQQLLVLPTSAVAQSGEETYVLTVEDSRVRRRAVETGVGGAGGTVVLSGVDEDALVVLSPATVSPDQPVEPVLVNAALEATDGL
ncbi:MAG: efflux RND transporter periplasmic adaptor subunit [Armatimonadota bacterium]